MVQFIEDTIAISVSVRQIEDVRGLGPTGLMDGTDDDRNKNKDMNLLLWVLQALLAVVFLLHGLLFVSLSPARYEQLHKRHPNSKPLPKLPRWFSMFIGVAEVLGAAGLILPGLSGIFTWLTPLAAAGLMLPSVGAAALHSSRGEPLQVIVTGILFVLTTFVAYMRWQVLSV